MIIMLYMPYSKYTSHYAKMVYGYSESMPPTVPDFRAGLSTLQGMKRRE